MMQQTDKEDENMKKFINQVELVEDQMIQGMVKAYPQYVRKLDCGNVVVRTEKKEGKVALISGGGSGHEPAHGGYVGTGMLDAAYKKHPPGELPNGLAVCYNTAIG